MPIPQQIGIYTIEASLGEGRLMQAFRASDPALKRTVALKVLPADALPAGISTRTFLEHARPALELVHPHLAWLWDAGEADGFCFLAERYIDGRSLVDLLSASGSLEWQQAESILMQVAQGLEFAHSRGYSHADLRPSNILMNPELGAVLTDFGPALALRESITPGPYLAPELQTGGSPSPASNQYALACILLELLTGERIPPFVDGHETRLWLQQRLEALKSPPTPIPWHVLPTLNRALAEDPGQRFASIGEFSREPARLAVAGVQEKQQYQAAIERQRQAEAEARRQDEESDRLAALERARLEMEEALHGTAPQEQNLPAADFPAVSGGGSGTELPEALSQAPRRAMHLPPRPIRRSLAAVLLVILVLVGVWAVRRVPWQAIFPPTVTPTPLPSFTATPSASPQPSSTSSSTLTPTSSATPTISPTATLSPTATPSPSPTETATLTLTATRTPRSDSMRGPERQGTGGP